jgi:hypothetical protein
MERLLGDALGRDPGGLALVVRRVGVQKRVGEVGQTDPVLEQGVAGPAHHLALDPH